MGDIPSNNKFHGEHDEHPINVDGTVYLPFSFRPKVSISAPCQVGGQRPFWEFLRSC